MNDLLSQLYAIWHVIDIEQYEHLGLKEIAAIKHLKSPVG